VGLGDPNQGLDSVCRWRNLIPGWRNRPGSRSARHLRPRLHGPTARRKIAQGKPRRPGRRVRSPGYCTWKIVPAPMGRCNTLLNQAKRHAPPLQGGPAGGEVSGPQGCVAGAPYPGLICDGPLARKRQNETRFRRARLFPQALKVRDDDASRKKPRPKIHGLPIKIIVVPKILSRPVRP
jgi:hypothetical protein